MEQVEQRLEFFGGQAGMELNAGQLLNFKEPGDLLGGGEFLDEQVVLDEQGPLQQPHLDRFLVLQQAEQAVLQGLDLLGRGGMVERVEAQPLDRRRQVPERPAGFPRDSWVVLFQLHESLGGCSGDGRRAIVGGFLQGGPGILVGDLAQRHGRRHPQFIVECPAPQAAAAEDLEQGATASLERISPRARMASFLMSTVRRLQSDCSSSLSRVGMAPAARMAPSDNSACRRSS
ncbi:MAG: hypothetical protein MZW92_49165 [Comamonadaceae bacterium]|nr:hypothetical protein [Comamonadaceae bacterium]